MSKIYEIYQKVTDNIISKLESAGSWQKLWNVTPPMNLSGRYYHGVNFLLLSSDEYSIPVYGTFNQIRQNGGQVKRGEKATLIVFWSFITDADPETGKTEKKYFLKYYNVFNVSQADFDSIGKEKINQLARVIDNPVYPTAESVIASFIDPPVIFHDKSDRASYFRHLDRIRIPEIQWFQGSDEYYHTLFHELIHSTAHSKRLDRFAMYKDFNEEQLHSYSKEELVAELGASYLSAYCGLKPGIDNSAAYIHGWSSKLKENTSWIIWAANRAQEAANFILQKEIKEVEV